MSSPNTSIAMAASLHCISVSESGIEVGGGGDGGTEEENLIVSLCVCICHRLPDCTKWYLKQW